MPDAWKYFKRAEFGCKCGCGTNEISNALVDWLDMVRHACDFPLIVTSGYRCPDYDTEISGAGVHPTGLAADLAVSGKRCHKLVKVAMRWNVSGLGQKQHGPHAERFVHLDLLDTEPRPWVWTYPR